MCEKQLDDINYVLRTLNNILKVSERNIEQDDKKERVANHKILGMYCGYLIRLFGVS